MNREELDDAARRAPSSSTLLKLLHQSGVVQSAVRRWFAPHHETDDLTQEALQFIARRIDGSKHKPQLDYERLAQGAKFSAWVDRLLASPHTRHTVTRRTPRSIATVIDTDSVVSPRHKVNNPARALVDHYDLPPLGIPLNPDVRRYWLSATPTELTQAMEHHTGPFVTWGDNDTQTLLGHRLAGDILSTIIHAALPDIPRPSRQKLKPLQEKFPHDFGEKMLSRALDIECSPYALRAKPVEHRVVSARQLDSYRADLRVLSLIGGWGETPSQARGVLRQALCHTREETLRVIPLVSVA